MPLRGKPLLDLTHDWRSHLDHTSPHHFEVSITKFSAINFETPACNCTPGDTTPMLDNLRSKVPPSFGMLLSHYSKLHLLLPDASPTHATTKQSNAKKQHASLTHATHPNACETNNHKGLQARNTGPRHVGG
eukprot:1136471-Pelagomonas_calceolata.AAC.16